MLGKGLYPYKYNYDWEKFSKSWLPEKEHFRIHWKTEDITADDYLHAKKVCKDFELCEVELSGAIKKRF